MSQGDMSKLRQMYQCDEGKSLCDKIQGPCVALPLLVKSKYREFSLVLVLWVTCIVFTSFSNFVLKIIWQNSQLTLTK